MLLCSPDKVTIWAIEFDLPSVCLNTKSSKFCFPGLQKKQQGQALDQQNQVQVANAGCQLVEDLECRVETEVQCRDVGIGSQPSCTVADQLKCLTEQEESCRNVVDQVGLVVLS